MTHFFVFQQLGFPLVTFITFITAERFESAVYVLHMIVQSGVAGEVFGTDVAHEPVGRSVALQVASVQFELRELLVAVLTGLGYSIGSAGTLVEVIDKLDGAAVVLTDVQLADWTVETGGLGVIIRSVCDDIQTSLVAGSEVLFQKVSVIKDLVAEMAGKESGRSPT